MAVSGDAKVNGNVVESLELPSDPIGGGSGDKRFFYVKFLGKTNTPEFPYTVANEVVASQVGRALGLRVPIVLTHSVDDADCALIQWSTKHPLMQQPPPATAKAVADYVQSHPIDVHGAIIFDLFIANNDRAFGPIRRNVMLDSDGRLLLIDHGNCCFYRNRPASGITAGIGRLEAVASGLAAMFDMDHKQNTYREFLNDWELVRTWCEKIRHLPEFLIEAAVGLIPPKSATATERQRLIEFLVKRREYLYDQIVACRHVFSGLPDLTETSP